MIDFSNPFDITKNINTKSGHYDLTDHQKSLPIFVINKVFSNTLDSLMFSNEVNKFSIDDDQMIYDFYYYALPKKNRYGKYNKKLKLNDDKFIDAISEVYGYSREKSLEVAEILYTNKDDIMKLVYRGGKGNG